VPAVADDKDGDWRVAGLRGAHVTDRPETGRPEQHRDGDDGCHDESATEPPEWLHER